MSLPKQTFTTAQGIKYSFIHIPPTHNHQTLLLLHGFPSTLHDWTYQISFFSAKGYGVLALDLLGYGDTDVPDDVDRYRLESMSRDITQILDSLHLRRVVGVGHDFGATLLSRVVAYHPSRFSHLVFLAVGPPPMGTPFDLEGINKMTKHMLGYELLGYIPFIVDETSPGLLQQHAESVMSLVFCRDAAEWKTWFHPLDKMQEFVTEDKRLKMGEWYTPDLQQHHLHSFGSGSGYQGASRWYRMWRDNLFAADEVGYENFKISQPTLLIISPEGTSQEQMVKPWVPRLESLVVEAGHWIHLEKAKETNEAIAKFLDRD